MSKVQLLYVEPETSLNAVIKIIKSKIKDHDITYVTINKPHHYIIDKFKQKKIPVKKIFYIDCITRKTNEELDKCSLESCRKCFFLESAQSLTGISIALNQALKFSSSKQFIIFDSLSSLLVYHSQDVIVRFFNFIVNLVRLESNADMGILAVPLDKKREVIKNITSIVDEVKKL